MSTSIGRKFYQYILSLPPDKIRIRHFSNESSKGRVQCWLNIELPQFIKDLGNTFTLTNHSSNRQLFGAHYLEQITHHLFRTHFTFFLRYLDLVSEERYKEYDLFFSPWLSIGDDNMVLSICPEDVVCMLEEAYTIVTNCGHFSYGLRDASNDHWAMQYRAATVFAASLRRACKSGESVVTAGIVQEAIVEDLRCQTFHFSLKSKLPNRHVGDLENYLIDPVVQSVLRSIRGFKYWSNDAALVKLWELAPELRTKAATLRTDISRTDISGSAILERVEWEEERRWERRCGGASCG